MGALQCFFGVHQWELIGKRIREWTSGRTEQRLLNRCKCCGKVKVFP